MFFQRKLFMNHNLQIKKETNKRSIKIYKPAWLKIIMKELG